MPFAAARTLQIPAPRRALVVVALRNRERLTTAAGDQKHSETAGVRHALLTEATCAVYNHG